MLHCVMMAGGLGTRFWPLSRRACPKQFLTLSGNRSLLQRAYDRTQPWLPADQVWVVTGTAFSALVCKQLPDVAAEHVLLEPCGRNTAPCIALAALQLLAVDPDAVMLVTPADHVITPTSAFQHDIAQAQALVEEDHQRLVLLGVPPTTPATGFGYIERGKRLDANASEVASFREKPDLATAETYLREGQFLWNCGIFVWKATRILELLERYVPEFAAPLDELQSHVGKPSWNVALNDIFPRMKSISIDYAVLERESNLAVLQASFDWDDVGSWEAMARLQSPDDNENVTSGQFLSVNSSRCIVHAEPGHLVAAVGIEDCIIVQAGNVTFVARRGDEAGIRELIAQAEAEGLSEFL